MILSQKNIEEIAVAVIRDFQKSFFGSEANDPARFALDVYKRQAIICTRWNTRATF